MKLKDLAIEHPYYSSEDNYFSNSVRVDWDTAEDFLDEMEDSDIDMNQVFRWDIYFDEGIYSANVFIIHQRKGIYAPHIINKILEKDVDRFIAYLEKHYMNLQLIWKPISK